jgi:formylglycine-generating enzyme required for sulfatase activity
VLALVLLAFASAVVGGIILMMLDRRKPPEDDDVIEEQWNKLHMGFVRLPAGPFDREAAPRGRRVVFSRPLLVGTTEVTREQFRAFVEATGRKTVAERDNGPTRGSLKVRRDGEPQRDPTLTWDHGFLDVTDVPVTCVAWEDAVVFCNWLSEHEGLRPCYRRNGEDGDWECDFKATGYRLPTDAEWEYATRAGHTALLPLTGESLGQYGWFRQNSEGQAKPVRRLLPNARNLRDVWGNVWEWCWDWEGPPPVDNPLRDPVGPSIGEKRIVWGGGWNDTPASLARTPRKGLPPEYRATDVGFRVVRTAEP